MADFLVKQGVIGVVATPHWMEGYYTPQVTDILALIHKLQQKLDQKGIDLKVYPGSEVHLSPNLPELVRRGKILTINNGGKYLLVELPFNELPYYTDEILFRLKIDGITPIIAHPERNQRLTEQPARLAALVRMGCLSQINAGSLTGLHGPKAQNCVITWLRQNVVHFIGSDLHNCNGAMTLENVSSTLGYWTGQPEVFRITNIRAEWVLDGRPPMAPKPTDNAKKGLLEKFLNKTLI